jgi:PAS domain-containing protein
MPYFIRRSHPSPTATRPPIDPAWQPFLDAAPAMIWISDPDGRLLLVNSA